MEVANHTSLVSSRAVGNAFGKLFRVVTWGESHGAAVGCVVDGCPSQLEIAEAEIQFELDRRKPGQSAIVSQRKESDVVKLLSGVYEGRTLGTPIAMMVLNEDARPEAYEEMKTKFRPSHADFTYHAKYGHRDWRGGGRTSARETVGRVAAGAIAKKLLRTQFGVELIAWVDRVHDVSAHVDENGVTLDMVEANAVRCPDHPTAETMIARIEEARKQGDSLGGIIRCIARNVPVGLGEPVFDRLEADLGKAVLSLPACKGFDIGSGFDGVSMTGLQHNDPFYMDAGRVRTKTNFSGGIQGGISNGETISLRAAFKPTATVMREQQTVDVNYQDTRITARGRHDPCVLPRAVPMVEAMVALVMADHALRFRAIQSE